ncbi:NADPH:quinone reductase [Streptomyces sp. 150FB]|uniref:quinone oxidoreductase family protein n=1 Tax=Streptomyces sp. 150FB TaxID=1576605 RepID=UPI00058957E9|nr:NADP-dependent oxidoreductase [Streptomyces sp. 150FB]KIF77936.1 NADPH:quinone reductase [Streptomyces sp. 150FB]
MSKAYVFTRHGGPEAESFVDRPPPVPGPGQLRVAVRAAGVNPVDWKLRNGYTRPGAAPLELPAVFGSEAAGVVEEVGTGVEGFTPGDAVYGATLTGGYAEHTLLPATVCAHKPDALSYRDAATLPVAAATAYDAVRQVDLRPGATLLVTGVGGGVGVATAQIARSFGLRVIGTASAGKKDFVESLGAVHLPPGPDIARRVRDAAPDGVDAVIDLVGGADLEAVAELLGQDDRTKLISGADRDTVTRLGGSPIVRQRTAAVLDEVAKLVIGGALNPYVTQTFPLERAADALRAVEQGHVQGKIVIEVDA